MFLLDNTVLTWILSVTHDILRLNFYYQNETLNPFFDEFTDIIATQYCVFLKEVDKDFLNTLKHDVNRRKRFTSYFVSNHLLELLINKLHFSEKEITLFENILPKFVGVQNVKQQSVKRTSH